MNYHLKIKINGNTFHGINQEKVSMIPFLTGHWYLCMKASGMGHLTLRAQTLETCLFSCFSIEKFTVQYSPTRFLMILTKACVYSFKYTYNEKLVCRTHRIEIKQASLKQRWIKKFISKLYA